jgi:hypothetical protein
MSDERGGIGGGPVIFLSIGRPLCDAQRDFKVALMQAIRGRGFEPRTVGSGPEDTDVPHDRPIEQVRRLLKSCDGAVIVGYEKHTANKLVTNSLAPHPGKLDHVRFTTSWNQAEAAMAYHADLPLLLVCEDGVLGECILEEGTVGSIARIPISKEAVLDTTFQKRMSSWANDVLERKLNRQKHRFTNASGDNITIRDLIDLFVNLSWKTAMLLIGFLLALTSAAYSAGFYVSAHGWFK